VHEPTRNEEVLETHLASGAALATCLVSVRVLSKSSNSQSMLFLCKISIFLGGGKKIKPHLGRLQQQSAQWSMSLVITVLQNEVSKPALHFTQGYSETEQGEGEQRHLAPLRAASPQADPKRKCCS